LQEKSIEKCHCANPLFLSLFPQAQLCIRKSELACTNQIFDAESFGNLSESCLNLCPLECNQTEYIVSSTNINVIGDIYADYLNENKNLREDFSTPNPIDAQTAANNFVYLFVSYESLSYEIASQLANMDVVLLLSNIGGTLGLFLGISVLSLCEIVEVFLELYFIKRENKKKRTMLKEFKNANSS
jgi:hypothetical protein